MPRASNGTYTLPNAAFVTATVIASAVVNGNNNDIAVALTQSIATTGVSTMTAPLPGFAGTASLPGYTTAGLLSTGFFRVSANVWGWSAVGTEAWESAAAGITAKNGLNFVDQRGNTVLAVPVGTMFWYGGTTAPTGWLFCAGQTAAQATYPALFALLGTTYGSAGGGNFTLPDFRGRYGAGFDKLGGTAAGRLTAAATNGVDGSAIANTGGLQNVTLTQAMFPVYNLTNNLVVTIGGGTQKVDLSQGNCTPSGPSAGTTINSNVQTTVTIGGSVTGSVTSGGSGIALNTVQPTLMLTKIIFTGVLP